jgi:hypothetical protein
MQVERTVAGCYERDMATRVLQRKVPRTGGYGETESLWVGGKLLNL